MPQLSSKLKAKTREVPKGLRPFVFHGLELTHDENSTQAKANCPFCGKEAKFHCNVESGEWDCKSCSARGNATTFLRQLWEESDKQTRDYDDLATDRLLLAPETLMFWGVARSVLTDEWLVPGYGVDGKLNQLYRYVTMNEGGVARKKLLATTDMNHHLHGVNLYEKAKGTVYICEGPWDAMVLWEILRGAKRDDEGKLVPTANEQASLLKDINILAVPGASTWLPSWTQLCAGKKVVLLYDNDHPRKNGQLPGLEGMKRAAQSLASAEEPPKEIKYLEWGSKGYNPDLPDGYDVRDCITASGHAIVDASRLPHLEDLLKRIKPVPEDWLEKVARTTLPCDSWRDLTTQWRKAFKWTEGLDRALSVMLASVISTKAAGDQLWVKIIGPAASGKSTLCEALSVNKKHILPKSTIRGFLSGFKEKGSNEDRSLISQLDGKTLVTKDGDTLLQSPNLGQILAEARDIYDRNTRSHYRNNTGRDYLGVSMTWILCGTSSLRSIDKSELGERFLDCVIMEEIDTELEDEILDRAYHKSSEAVNYEANGKAASQDGPEMVKAKQLTGGYVDHLRRNALSLLSSVEIPDHFKRPIINLAKFTAIMRARPSTKQDETAERELASRLTSQLVRLTKCLAAVLGKKVVDAEIIRRVRRVALDTSRGITLNMLTYIMEEHSKLGAGAEAKAVAFYTNQTLDKCNTNLRFLRRIKAVEQFSHKVTSGYSGAKPRYRLTEGMEQLYTDVMAEN